MPVLATPSPIANVLCCDIPAVIPTPAAVPCVGMYVLSAHTATDNNQPLFSRLKSVSLKAGQAAKLDWQMTDPDGRPVDLSECVCPVESSGSQSSSETCAYTLAFRLQEYLSLGSSCLLSLPVDVDDPASGQVSVQLPQTATGTPGIYFGEIAIQGIGDDDVPYDLFVNAFYVHIGRVAGSLTSRMGPPSVAEVRLHLRDSSAAESYLLNRLRFDDAEIALATVRPIEYFNEVPPDLGRYYTTSTFPWRHFWLDAIAGNLFLMAAEQYRANQLTYSAGGIQVEDQAKEQPYEQAAARRMQDWRDWVKRKKAEINMNACFGGVGGYQGW